MRSVMTVRHLTVRALLESRTVFQNLITDIITYNPWDSVACCTMTNTTAGFNTGISTIPGAAALNMAKGGSPSCDK